MTIDNAVVRIREDVMIDDYFFQKGMEFLVDEQDRHYVYLLGKDNETHIFTYEQIEKYVESLEFHKYLIIMRDYDDVILNIEQDINRPNNPEDSELIDKYMENNYQGHSFYTVNLDHLDGFKVINI